MEQSRAATAEHHANISESMQATWAREHKGQHRTPCLLCYLLNYLDGMHCKLRLCISICQRLLDCAAAKCFVDVWFEHLRECGKLYVTKSKYNKSDKDCLSFDGNAARVINDDIHFIIQCNGKHNNKLFDTLSERCLQWIRETCSAEVRIANLLYFPLAEQQKLDLWKVFTECSNYAIALAYQFRPSAASRYIMALSTKLIFDLRRCNNMSMEFRKFNMERAERLNKRAKFIQKRLRLILRT